MEIDEKLKEEYQTKIEIYKRLSKSVADDIKSHLNSYSLTYHQIIYREKSLEGFESKASNPKYISPLDEITDLAGIRVITRILSEQNPVIEFIEHYFQIDPRHSSDKSNLLGEQRMGYISHHFVGEYRSDSAILIENPDFLGLKFEIQVRTLLQHAWAEVEHANIYKFKGKLPSKFKREFNLVSASLEILDNKLEDLTNEIQTTALQIAEMRGRENYAQIEVSSPSLIQFLKVEFKDALEKDKVFFESDNFDQLITDEISRYPVKFLDDLQQITPTTLESVLINNHYAPFSTVDLIRCILIINSIARYYSSCYRDDWEFETKEDMVDLLRKFNCTKNELNRCQNEGYFKKLKFYFDSANDFAELREEIKKRMVDWWENNRHAQQLDGNEKVMLLFRHMRDWNDLLARAGNYYTFNGLITTVANQLGYISFQL